MYAITVYLLILHEQWYTIDRGFAINIPGPPNNFVIFFRNEQILRLLYAVEPGNGGLELVFTALLRLHFVKLT